MAHKLEKQKLEEEEEKEVSPDCRNGDGTRKQPITFNEQVPLEGPEPTWPITSSS